MKGIFAVFVLIHHLYQHSGIFRAGWLRYVGACCQALGFFSVAVFFFLSGYGLLASYTDKPESIHRFVKTKILPFYLIDVLLVAIYSAETLLLSGDMSLSIILKSLTFGGTVISNGWYIQVQLLYYTMFFVVFRFKRNCPWMPLMIMLHTIYLILGWVMGLGTIYYERTYIFVVGMLWYENRERIDEWLRDKRLCFVVWIISLVLFAGNYLVSYLLAPAIFRGISYFFMIPVILIPLMIMNIQNKVTQFLGRISFEIYVTQGLFLKLFHSGIVNIKNPYIYILAVTSATFLAAFAIQPIVKAIYQVCRRSR